MFGKMKSNTSTQVTKSRKTTQVSFVIRKKEEKYNVLIVQIVPVGILEWHEWLEMELQPSFLVLCFSTMLCIHSSASTKNNY